MAVSSSEKAHSQEVIMDSKKIKTSHIIVFIILILFFSAFPFISSLLFDKSSLLLAHLTIWYAIIPPVIIFLLAYLLYRKEENFLLHMGRTWIFVGLWFLMQLFLSAISGLSILLRLLSFPATTVGNTGFIAGSVIFILGGILFIALGNRRSIAIPYRKGITLSANIAILLVIILISIFALGSTRLSEQPLIEDSKVPSEEQIFGWIEDVYNFGIRRTGSSADLRAIDYIQEKLKEFGIADIRAVPFTFDYWEPISWKLSILEPAGKTYPMTCFYVPYTGPTGTDGITADLVYLGKGSQEDFEGADVKGKIILVDMPPTNISWEDEGILLYGL